MEPRYFANSLEHLLAELERISLLINMHVRAARLGHEESGEFQGLFISEQEIDLLLSQSLGSTRWASALEHSSLSEQKTALAALAKNIAGFKAESIKRNIPLRLEKLARIFHLSPFDIDVMLVCLAPELDLRFEKLYAYLHDDVTRKRPSVDLVLNLLCYDFHGKLTARKRFNLESPLFKHFLLELVDEPSQPNSTMLNKYLKVDKRIASFLLDDDRIDFRLQPFLSVIESQCKFSGLILPAEILNRLLSLTKSTKIRIDNLILYFLGPYGVGKQSTAEALCQELGIGILVVEGDYYLTEEFPSFAEKIRLAFREARLQEAAIYWSDFDTLLAKGKRVLLKLFLNEFSQHHGLSFLAGTTAWEPRDTLHNHRLVPIKFAIPSFRERIDLWNKSLNANINVAPDVDLSTLANKFSFSGGQIQDAVASAQNRAILETTQNNQLNMTNLHVACRAHSNKNLNRLSQKIKPKFAWDDIVLPADQLAQLREVTDQVKYKHVVYGDWDFVDKLSLGKGLNMLFHGPPGTGKTMAADILANELQLDLYKIDLSTVVSKYIGETEKNLSKIFKEAKTSNAILFFDEADALFGKRSEVNDAHDRYANIEISYLLQKMEDYEGITILATNLMQNIDEAFVRRIRFIIEFPFPTEEYRLRIWERIWPQNTPVSAEVDFGYMAEQFEIAGGNIRNVALNAAFYAAADGHFVTMKHMIQATKRELQKMGNLFIKADFGAFHEYV
jgi:SpoVK/Ycf46/Vps4 family AAA+-type ATPase